MLIRESDPPGMDYPCELCQDYPAHVWISDSEKVVALYEKIHGRDLPILLCDMCAERINDARREKQKQQ